jgi:copper resistance protein B
MKKFVSTMMALSITGIAPASGMGMDDDPLVARVMIDQLEVRDAEGDKPVVWEVDAWIGKDRNKIWLKTEGEQVSGETEEAELQLLYSRAVSPFWDLQVGWRHDIKPEPERDWFAIGVKGLSPYLFEVDASLFAGAGGQVGARLQAEYEYLFTQRLVLSPEVELNFHTRDDEATGTGSGLSDAELGLRLRYEVRREFAPYIGVNWWSKYGNTADYAMALGGETDDVQFVAGIRAWF